MDSETNPQPASNSSEDKAQQEAVVAEGTGDHTLETSWTFWFDKKSKDKTKDYKDNLINLGTFSTIEDFWRYYSHLKRPSELQKDCNYHLFRGDVLPMWESFPKGGCFIKKIKKNEGNLLDRMWEELLFAAVGEFFEEPDIVGVVLSIRAKEDVLSIWNRDNQSVALKMKISEKLKEIWEDFAALEYKDHASSMKDQSTYRTHQKPAES